jgi:type II secretory pathway component PulF
MLLSQSQSNRIKLFVSKLIYHIEQGESMTESLKAMNFKIPIIVLAIIDVGLASGDLATAFQKAALFFKQENEHRQKTVEITLYPFCVFFSVICLFYFVTHTLIPQMSSYLTESGPYQKSFATSSLLMTSAIFENYGLWIAVSLGGALAFLVIGRFLSQKLRYKLSWFSLKIPFWGKLFLYHEMSQWLSTLSLLSHSGMDFQKAFQKGNEGLKNLYLKHKLEKALDDFSKGLSFCDLLEKQHLLPHLSLQLCRVGFESAEIDVMFKKAALLLKEDEEQKMSLFFKIVHPLTLILLASFILWIVCGVLLPLYNHFALI